MSTLTFEPPSRGTETTHVLIGRKEALLSDGAKAVLPEGIPAELWASLVDKIKPGDAGSSASTLFMAGKVAHTVVAAALPDHCSRHNSQVRPHAITELAGVASGAGPAGATIVAVLDDAAHAAAAGCAIARAFPLYSAKKQGEEPAPIRVGYATREGPLNAGPYAQSDAAAKAVRLAARLVDAPPEELDTTAFVREARAVAARLQAAGREVSVEVIEGEELQRLGYGALYAVGKAATRPPALVVLSHAPATRKAGAQSVCLVGKGIVYDTGGLSLKGGVGMCGMKRDMGGAAGVLGAFEAAVEIGISGPLACVLCLAENAIGPLALRNDDIVRCLSGKSVEINNTDAEGRLVLADGVAHASASPPKLPLGTPDLIIDMATLTGAQMIATGQRHAGIMANSDEVERAAVLAGRRSGDLVHPLPYCPEFYRAEFKSEVAHRKNSVDLVGRYCTMAPLCYSYTHLTRWPTSRTPSKTAATHSPRARALSSASTSTLSTRAAGCTATWRARPIPRSAAPATAWRSCSRCSRSTASPPDLCQASQCWRDSRVFCRAGDMCMHMHMHMHMCVLATRLHAVRCGQGVCFFTMHRTSPVKLTVHTGHWSQTHSHSSLECGRPAASL